MNEDRRHRHCRDQRPVRARCGFGSRAPLHSFGFASSGLNWANPAWLRNAGLQAFTEATTRSSAETELMDDLDHPTDNPAAATVLSWLRQDQMDRVSEAERRQLGSDWRAD